MAKQLNTQTKYPTLNNLLFGLTGFQFTDMEADLIVQAVEVDQGRHNADYMNQRSDQKEIQLIEKFKTYKQVKQTK